MGLKVLSLFDGMSCGRIALERLGVPVDMYVASEIDRHAVQVTKNNYPDTVHIGSVTEVGFSEGEVYNWVDSVKMGKVDLLLGGSPCQNFSFAGSRKGMQTVDNEEILTLDRYLELKEEGFSFHGQSFLFWEYVRVLKEIQRENPNVYFLLENVKMVEKWQDLISSVLGIEPVEINSSLVSAQNRRRLYWTNIPGVLQPKDKGILLEDIIHEKREEDISVPLDRHKVPFDKTLRILDKEVMKGKVGFFRQDSQANRVYSIHGKAVTLCGNSGGGTTKKGQYLFGVITPDRLEKRQNGQRFNDGKKFYTLTTQDRHGVMIDGYIRKLTPTECERLQTVEEGYTEGVSDAQRYRMLGNGWTVDVIAHILSFAKWQ